MAAAFAMSEETLKAYRETEYRVQAEPPFTLMIGQVCPELVSAHSNHSCDCSAFITACNPFSKLLTEEENTALQESFSEELSKAGLSFLRGVGQHPSNDWPGEPSFLIFGLRLEEASAWGKKLQQNAVVWSGADGLPQLVLLR